MHNKIKIGLAPDYGVVTAGALFCFIYIRSAGN